MKKKLTALAMVVVLGATAAIGGTLAYFTDTDSATNVMTTGKVDIKQNENGDAGFETQPLMPMVNKMEAGDATIVDGMFNAKMKNVVDKVVTVTNEADAKYAENSNYDAYVRTILLFETAKEYEEGTDTVLRDGLEIFDTYIGVLSKGLTWMNETVTIDGQEYVVAYRVYEDALAAGKTSEASLKQIFLSPEADNEVAKLFGEDYKVLALSQGTQTAGFDKAADALDTAFGEITLANVAGWFK